MKAYNYCLTLIPNHDEARSSLQYIKNKLQAESKKDAEEPLVDLKMLSQLLNQSEDKQHLLREIKKLKNMKK